MIFSDVKFVFPILEKIRANLFTKKLNDRIIRKALNREFSDLGNKNFSKIRFLYTDSEISPSERQRAVYIASAKGFNNGYIKIYYRDGLYKVFEKDFLYWKVFINVVEESIAHEIIHIGQFDRILKKYLDHPKKYINVILNMAKNEPEIAKDYMSLKREIMPFARQSVQEFKSHGFSNKEIVEYIRCPSKADIDDSFLFYGYANLLNRKSKSFKKFINYIYEYVVK